MDRWGRGRRTRITAEDQRAFDERTKLIEARIAELDERIAAKRAQQSR
jgi:hypothetical protein